MKAALSAVVRCASLLLAVTAAALWVRSHYVTDAVAWDIPAPPRPQPAAAPASNHPNALFLLLKNTDHLSLRRSVRTAPGRLVVQQRPNFETFV